jgi:hypothetical protein
MTIDTIPVIYNPDLSIIIRLTMPENLQFAHQFDAMLLLFLLQQIQ